MNAQTNVVQTNVAQTNVVPFPDPGELPIQPQQIELGDIAKGLARVDLYPGYARQGVFYSVGIRSCWLARYLYRHHEDADLALHGLLYWSALAYVDGSASTADECLQMKQMIYQALDLPPLTYEQVILLELAQEQATLMEMQGLTSLPDACTLMADPDAHATALGFTGPVAPWIVTGAFMYVYETLTTGENLT